MDWVPGTVGIRHWTFVHAVGESPRILGCDFESKLPNVWVRDVFGDWAQKIVNPDDSFSPLKALPDDEFFSGVDGSGRRIIMIHSLVTQSLIGLVRDQAAWIGFNNISATSDVHSFQVIDLSGDNQADLVFFDGSQNAVCLVQQHLPGVLGPLHLDMGCGFGPQEWLVPGEQTGSLWTRPFWDAVPKSFRMHLEEALLPTSESVHEVIHHSGRAFLVKDSSFMEMKISESLEAWHAEELTPWVFDPEESLLSSRGVLGLYVPSARMKVSTTRKSLFNHVAVLPLHEWSHFVYTRDRNLRVKSYLNGELVASAPGADIPYDHRNLILGAGYGRGWYEHFHGCIDEVEVIHRVLSEEEVRQRWMNRRAVTNPWTVSLVSFDSDLGFDSVPREEISNAPFRTYGSWQYDEGIHGRGIRFDGKSGAMRVAADLPEVDVTYSFWIRPEKPIEAGANQVPVSGYGMYNTNFMLLDLPVSVPIADPLELFEVEKFSAPEPGRLHLHNAQRFWLGQSLQLYLVEGGQWRVMECGGEVPVDGMGIQTIWEEDGAIHRVNPDNGQIHVLDLESFQWRKGSRLPLVIAGSQVVACSQSGHAFGDFHLGNVWWWPESESKIYSVLLPHDLLPSGDEWTGFSMSLGAIEVSSRGGVHAPLIVDDAEQPLQVSEESTDVGFLRWVSLVFVGFFMWMVYRITRGRLRSRSRTQESGHFRRRNGAYSEELLEVIERLKRCESEVLDSASLDVLLGLSDLESEETRRSHRARWVKEVNDWSRMERSKPGIVREKDPMDRRRMLYRLDVQD